MLSKILLHIKQGFSHSLHCQSCKNVYSVTASLDDDNLQDLGYRKQLLDQIRHFKQQWSLVQRYYLHEQIFKRAFHSSSTCDCKSRSNTATTHTHNLHTIPPKNLSLQVTTTRRERTKPEGDSNSTTGSNSDSSQKTESRRGGLSSGTGLAPLAMAMLAISYRENEEDHISSISQPFDNALDHATHAFPFASKMDEVHAGFCPNFLAPRRPNPSASFESIDSGFAPSESLAGTYMPAQSSHSMLISSRQPCPVTTLATQFIAIKLLPYQLMLRGFNSCITRSVGPNANALSPNLPGHPSKPVSKICENEKFFSLGRPVSFASSFLPRSMVSIDWDELIQNVPCPGGMTALNVIHSKLHHDFLPFIAPIFESACMFFKRFQPDNSAGQHSNSHSPISDKFALDTYPTHVLPTPNLPLPSLPTPLEQSNPTSLLCEEANPFSSPFPPVSQRSQFVNPLFRRSFSYNLNSNSNSSAFHSYSPLSRKNPSSAHIAPISGPGASIAFGFIFGLADSQSSMEMLAAQPYMRNVSTNDRELANLGTLNSRHSSFSVGKVGSASVGIDVKPEPFQPAPLAPHINSIEILPSPNFNIDSEDLFCAQSDLQPQLPTPALNLKVALETSPPITSQLQTRPASPEIEFAHVSTNSHSPQVGAASQASSKVSASSASSVQTSRSSSPVSVAPNLKSSKFWASCNSGNSSESYTDIESNRKLSADSDSREPQEPIFFIQDIESNFGNMDFKANSSQSKQVQGKKQLVAQRSCDSDSDYEFNSDTDSEFEMNVLREHEHPPVAMGPTLPIVQAPQARNPSPPVSGPSQLEQFANIWSKFEADFNNMKGVESARVGNTREASEFWQKASSVALNQRAPPQSTNTHHSPALVPTGSVAALYNLAILAEMGFRPSEKATASPDYKQAFAYYSKAAEYGHAGAMYALSVMYAHGRGVRSNEMLSLHWLQRAADSKSPQALAYIETCGGLEQSARNLMEAMRESAPCEFFTESEYESDTDSVHGYSGHSVPASPVPLSTQVRPDLGLSTLPLQSPQEPSSPASTYASAMPIQAHAQGHTVESKATKVESSELIELNAQVFYKSVARSDYASQCEVSTSTQSSHGTSPMPALLSPASPNAVPTQMQIQAQGSNVEREYFSFAGDPNMKLIPNQSQSIQTSVTSKALKVLTRVPFSYPHLSIPMRPLSETQSSESTPIEIGAGIASDAISNTLARS